MKTKLRFNIERLAFMVTVVIILAIVLGLTVDDEDLVWQITLGACFFIPAAYFTVNYFSDRVEPGGIFYEDEKQLPMDVIGSFSWSKYFMEFIVFAYVIGFLIISGLIMFVFKWASNIGVSEGKVVKSNDALKEIDINPIFERSKTIIAEMGNSANYLAHDSALLNDFIIIVAITSLLGFSCALLLLLFRKKSFLKAKIVRTVSYVLTAFSLIAALFFLIFHNSFFISDNLRKLIDNKNTDPGMVTPGLSIKVTLSNSSGITSINRYYKDVSININESTARHNDGSTTSFKNVNLEPINKWGEMKTNDHQSLVFPMFNMTIPEDPILYGSIIDMKVTLSMIIPYFPKGTKYNYDLARASLNEYLFFRIANIEEIKFYKSSKKLTSRIWYTNLFVLIIFIFTLILGERSVFKK